MAKGTAAFLYLLSLAAVFLLGINFGRNLSLTRSSASPSPTPVPPSPTVTPTPTSYLSLTPTQAVSSVSAIKKTTGGNSTYTDRHCGFSFTYSGSYINSSTNNNQSTILLNPDNPADVIAATCAASIPRPPVTSDKIDSITVGGVPATLYHDQNSKDGSPRDEVIVKHPSNGLEIIVAGYGATFQSILSTFRFVQ